MNSAPSSRITTARHEETSGPLRPIVSVVIVSYLNVDLVRACLDSLLRHNDIGARLEVVVVDNSPHHEVAESLSRIYRRQGKPFRFIKNENRGFGQGNNVGIAHTRGDYLILLNPDTELTEGLFAFTAETFSLRPQLGAFGVQQRGPAGDKRMSFYWIDRSGVFAALLIKAANKVGLYSWRSMFTSGAALFLRRTAFRSAGGFDDNIFLYNEERDLFRRIHLSGYTTEFFPNRELIHHEGGGSPPSLASLRHRLESLRYYCRKYDLDYLAALRADLRVARLGYYAKLVQCGKNSSQARRRMEHLQNAVKAEANLRNGASRLNVEQDEE